MYYHVADVQQKVATVSRKSERLVNLTIALLATKRWLTKTEIFHSIEGYEGSNESKERMFERDKDDLRSLGIEIEVGSFDPLFEDEVGYRIKRERYELNLGQISPVEISLLSLATKAWQGASLNDTAQSAFVKLASLGIPTDEIEFPGFAPVLPNTGPEIFLLSRAIADHRKIQFTYVDSALTKEKREIVPTGLFSRKGYWYLSGVDLSIQEIRTFRLDRVDGDFIFGKIKNDFEVPLDVSVHDYPDDNSNEIFAIIDVRQGKGLALRSLATEEKQLGEWDQLSIPLHNPQTLASLVLWHGEDALVREPQDLRSLVIAQLQTLVSSHG